MEWKRLKEAVRRRCASAGRGMALAVLLAVAAVGLEDHSCPGLVRVYAEETEGAKDDVSAAETAPVPGDDVSAAETVPVPEDGAEAKLKITGYVQDDASLLSDDEEEALEEMCAGICREYRTEAYIITTPDFGGGDIKNWQRQIFTECGLGKDSAGSGVMLAVSMAERDWGLVGFGAAQEAFSTYGRELIAERILDDLSDGDYYDAFSQYLSMAEDYLKANEAGKPYTEDHPYGQGGRIPVIIGVSFLLSFVVSLSIVLSWKKGMNTRVPRDGAMEYMKAGSFRLYRQTDRFLYHTVRRTKRPENNHSGGSGGKGRVHSDRSGSSGKF